MGHTDGRTDEPTDADSCIEPATRTLCQYRRYLWRRRSFIVYATTGLSLETQGLFHVAPSLHKRVKLHLKHTCLFSKFLARSYKIKCRAVRIKLNSIKVTNTGSLLYVGLQRPIFFARLLTYVIKYL